MRVALAAARLNARVRTGEPTVDALLRRLVGGQLDALGTDPIGIYLFGSTGRHTVGVAP